MVQVSVTKIQFYQNCTLYTKTQLLTEITINANNFIPEIMKKMTMYKFIGLTGNRS